MNILAIDCATDRASVALRGDASFTCSQTTTGRSHDVSLFPALQNALQTLGDAAPLPYILVGSGPGSYSGVRVALAAATGVALVRSSRVVAIGSWEPLTHAIGCALLTNARRGGWAVYYAGGRVVVLDSASAVRALLAQGVDIRSCESDATLQRAGISLAHTGLRPNAADLIKYWLELPEQLRHQYSDRPPEPIYVRPPHITTPKHKPWEI